MQFQVPQFIEREAKIIGPFTFRQFIYVAIAGAFLLILYFSIPFYLFIIIAIILGGLVLALAFLKISGQPLSTVIKNFLSFLASPRVYIWKMKMAPPKMLEKEKAPPKKEEVEKVTAPKVAGGSRLKRLSIEVETRTK